MESDVGYITCDEQHAEEKATGLCGMHGAEATVIPGVVISY